MKSGAPAFGTPEYMKAQLVGGQLARRYSIPYRTSNTCAANTVDAQAAYESVFSLWGAIQGGANFMLHGAGWLEGGLRCSYEKTILDIDLLQMVAEFLTPLDLSDEALGFEAIQSVGPGGHFFGTQHTQDRYKTAFYSPIISDWRNFETWAEAGSPTAIERANRVWKERLAAYEEPYMDPAIREELNAFVDKRNGRRRRADGFLRCFIRSTHHAPLGSPAISPSRGEISLPLRPSPIRRGGMPKLPISRHEGEMAGRPEGGVEITITRDSFSSHTDPTS